MLKVQSPLTVGEQKPRPKSGRKALQPKNSIAEIERVPTKSKLRDSNKENHPIPIHATTTPTKELIEPSFDSSLAEELSAIRKRLERLRLDKERTDKMLREREKTLDLHFKELEDRGQIQKRLEIEVDRLFRLKELQSYYSLRISPIRSLREKEQEKISHSHSEVNTRESETEDSNESVDQNTIIMQSPCSSCSSISSQLVIVE